MQDASNHQQLIGRLEEESRRHPTRYTFKLAALASLGYAVLFGMLALLLLLTVGMFGFLIFTKAWILIKVLFKFIWVPLVLAWVILKSLWVRIPEPDGARITAKQAPVLFEEIERIRSQTGAPRLSGVILTEDFNAAAASVPRLGIFGWPKHFLILGLPLMQTLSREEFSAVLAHEFGHFRAAHGRFGGWIYRVRQTWYQVLGALQAQGSSVGNLLAKFFDWYAPYFNAYSFVFSRQNEYEADAVAAQITSPKIAASALLGVATSANRLESEFWPKIGRMANAESQAPENIYHDLRQMFRQPDALDKQIEREQQAFARPTDLHDTHPSLTDRLKALRQTHVRREWPTQSASEALLGAFEQVMVKQFSDAWLSHFGPQWAQQQEANATGRARLKDLQQRRNAGELLNQEEAFECLNLLEKFEPDFALDDALQEFTSHHPDHAPSQFMLGRRLLSTNLLKARTHLEKAAQLDPDASLACYQLLAQHYDAIGDFTSRDEMVRLLQAALQQQNAMLQERNEFGPKDNISKHTLSPDQCAQLRDTLERFGAVLRVHVVQKTMRFHPENPHHVMAVEFVSGSKREEIGTALYEAIATLGSIMMFDAKDQDELLKKIRKVAKEPIFDRGSWARTKSKLRPTLS